jgi:sugar phosphate isomerase/epimerase
VSRSAPGDPVVAASNVTLSGAAFGEPPRYGFATRCRAGVEAGLAGIGLHLDDPVLAEGGAGLDHVAEVLDATGMHLVEIELLTGWARGVPDVDRVDLLVALASRFRPHHVTAAEFGTQPIDVGLAARSLRPIATRFADLDVTVAVESFPWSGLRDVDVLLALLDEVAMPSVGAMVDVWHLSHCAPASRVEDVLDRAVAVQLNDGEPAKGDLLTAARASRLLPGEGTFAVHDLIAGLRRRGFQGPWCVEASDPTIRAAAVDTTAARVVASARAALR